MRTLLRELRHAARALRADVSFTVVAVLTLAVGIGASTAIFSAVDGVLLKPLPYADADRVVTVWERDRTSGERLEVAPGNFLDLRERARAAVSLAAAEPYSLDFAGADGPESLRTSLVSEGFFDVLGTAPRLGRTFRAEEFVAGRDRVVVLSDALWRERFGADAGVVGHAVTLDGQPYTIVGVMPPAFRIAAGSDGRDLWAPKVFTAAERTRRTQGYYTVVGRLAPGVSLERARATLATVGRQLAAEHPAARIGTDFTLVPLAEQLTAHVRPALLVLLGAAALLLLVACANVANLMLARTLARGREFAIRRALGAGRAHVVRQVVVESAVLALAGGMAGAFVAWWGVDAVRALSPSSLPRADELAVDGRALAFALGAAAVTACLFGALPAFRAASADLRERVEGGRATAGPARGRVRSVLTAAEVGIALVLLVGAGLLGRSALALLRVERGFRADHVAAVTVFVWGEGREPARRVTLVRELVDRVAALPGVRAAAMTSSLPLADPITGDEATFQIAGRAAPPAGEEPTAHVTVATEGYLDALGTPLRRGRAFTRADDARSVPVALVNEAFVRRHFPGEDALGRRIEVQSSEGSRGTAVRREIVGVVADVRQTGLAADPRPAIIVPHAQAPTGAVTIVVRTPGDPAAALDAIKRAVWSVQPSLAIYASTTLEDLVADQLREGRFYLLLLAGFAGAALALAGVGVYGALSHGARERSREMSVRVALGARAADVARLVLRQGAVPALAGTLGGALAAAALTRLLGRLLFGTPPLDPLTFGAAAALTLGVALVACAIPARRAGRVDPVAVLRAE